MQLNAQLGRDMSDLLKENSLRKVRGRGKRGENLVGEYLLYQKKSKDNVSVSV